MGDNISDDQPRGTDQPQFSVLDREQIDGLVEAAGIDGAREILDAFHRSTQELLAKLKDELGRGDLAEAARSAHALKGSAMNVGALALSSAARFVEDACKADDGGTALKHVSGADSQFAETIAAFDELLSNAA